MKRLFILLVVLCALPTLVFGQSAERLPGDEINRISQSVVLVLALDNGDPFSQGSGTIIDPAGYIFTNVHVIEGGDDFAILQPSDLAEPPELRYFASVVAQYPELDFAILQIDRDADGRGLDPDDLNLPFISLSEETVQLGDPVFVFGFPSIGEGYLVFTSGSITSIRNDDIGSQRVPFVYATDAEISPGNSGGLAVNQNGEFIGIPTEVVSEERTGGRLGGIYALPALRTVLNLEQQPQGSQSNPENLPDVEEVPPTPIPDFSQLDYTLPANYGGVQLESGFRDDPHLVEMQSGATEGAFVDIAATGIGAECVGYATPAPDYRVQWTGNSEGLRIFFYSTLEDGDTTLVINQPDGSWLCIDDASGLNPLIDILNPAEGQYDIWVGSFSPDENIPGYLVITENADVTPNALEQVLAEGS
jgi:serine protease Do